MSSIEQLKLKLFDLYFDTRRESNPDVIDGLVKQERAVEDQIFALYPGKPGAYIIDDVEAEARAAVKDAEYWDSKW